MMRFILSLFSLCLFFIGIATAQPKKSVYRELGAPLSPFRIQKSNGHFYNYAQLKKNQPVLLIIFSPDCSHCKHSLDTLQHSFQPELSKLQLVLVTEARHKAELQPFLKASGLNKDPKFTQVGVDSSNLIYNIYAYGMLPQFNYYNAKHKLVKTFSGIFPLDSLRSFLQQQPKN